MLTSRLSLTLVVFCRDYEEFSSPSFFSTFFFFSDLYDFYVGVVTRVCKVPLRLYVRLYHSRIPNFVGKNYLDIFGKRIAKNINWYVFGLFYGFIELVQAKPTRSF